MATIRRLTDYGWIFPQKFTLKPDGGGAAIANFSTNFNPFVHKLKVDVHGGNPLHPFVPLAAGILLVAIEGKQ